MRTASKLPKFFHFFVLLVLWGAGAGTFLGAQEAKSQPSTRLSIEKTSANIDFEFMNRISEDSRLVSLREIPLADSNAENASYQVIVEANIAQFSARIGKTDYSDNPIRIKDISPGTYSILFTQDGYKNLDLLLRIKAGTQYLITIELIPRTGGIYISGDQEIGSLEIDGEPANADQTIILPRGQHRIRARAFGWEDYNQAVSVNENMLTSVRLHFVPAPFTIQGMSSSRSLFRPANPGKLGSSTLSFEVTAPGLGRIIITDADGNEVISHDFAEFQTWRQEYVWNGRAADGSILPEGEYTWSIEASSLLDPIGDVQRQSARVTIDNASYIKFRPNLAGSAGVGLAGEAFTLAQGAFQTQLQLAWIPPEQAAGQEGAIQVLIGFRLGLIKNLELSLAAAGLAFLGDGSLASVLGGAQLNWAVIPLPAAKLEAEPSFGLSLNLGGAIPANDSSPLPYRAWANSQIPGAHIGTAAQILIGPFSFVLEPLLYLSPWPPVIPLTTSGSYQKLPAAQATFFASLNAGAYLDFDRFAAGLSAAVHTDSSFLPALPIPVALSIQFMPVEGFVIAVDAIEYFGSSLLGPPSLGLTIGLIQ